VVAALASPASAGAPIPPDGFIKKAGGAFEGIGVIDSVSAGAAQTVSKKVPPGGIAVFKAKAENTATEARDLRFVGSGEDPCCPGFKPRYFVGGENVTADATTGLEFPDVPAGETTATIRIEAKIKSLVAPGTIFFAPVIFYDPVNSQESDDHLEYRVKVV
jgi:hypothetical protein